MLAESDLLRLNVLLAQPVQAIRISESRMTLEALTDQGEARVELHPTLTADRYLREVRALLSTRVLGSPGGYPLYIRRWTRMGQARNGSLARLLLLGDPEAVAAVVHSPGLTLELAQHAWWINPCATHARCMLAQAEVADSELGGTLATYLREFLPFEEDAREAIASIRLLLRHPSLTREQHTGLWQRAQSRSAYLVGFLAAGAEHIPAERPAHARLDELVRVSDSTSPLAEKLRWALDVPGQNFLATLRLALRRPPSQAVVIELFNAIGRGFALPDAATGFRTLAELEADAPPPLSEGSSSSLAVMSLARVSETLLDPIFGVTNAEGSLMRKKIKPVTDAINQWIAALLDGASNG